MEFVEVSFEKLFEEQDKKGKINKTMLGMPSWKKITQTQINKKHTGRCVLTGKISGITVFDFDIEEVYYKFVDLYPDLKKYKTIKTKKGFHVYCNYDEDIKTTTEGFIHDKGVDIRNDGAIVFAPPCKRNCLDGSVFTYEDLGGEILPVPEIFIDNMKQLESSDTTEIAPYNQVSNEKQMAIDFKYIKEAIENNWLNDMAYASWDEWRNVGFAIKHTLGDQGQELFHQFSQINESKYDKKFTKKFWDNIKQGKKPLTLGSIKYWVRQYKEKHEPSSIHSLFTYDIATDYDIAKTIFEFKDIKYSFDNKSWYIFTEKWINDSAGSRISNLLSEEYWEVVNQLYKDTCIELEETEEKDKEFLTSKLKKIANLLIKLKKTTDKKNIMTELKNIAHDEEFRRQMNKQKYLLPLKGNKIIDLRTNEVRKITINDYFDYECPVSFINLSTEEEEEMRKYFEDLFCDVDTTQCFLDIIKSCITGETHRYIYFWVGNGSNGKSLILELIQKMFGKSADVISKDVVLQKKANTHLTTEFEKLDKTRFGFVTELEESDVLNEKTIKAISGGDAIDTRGICKTNETIYPTANINIITNELPKFKVAKAICDRIKMFPFDNVFEPNLKFKNDMLTKLDLVFSYIMKRGVVSEDFNFTERMNKKADEYKESNRIDFLEDFINTKCIRQGTIKRDDFILEYNKWLNETENEDKVTKGIAKRMSDLGISNKKSNHVVLFQNISIKLT
jgi:P4 family phage/plasmid primase-like protien